ncbi:MAG: hypothetical protein JJD92_13545 [Frankiaceae bacterium]|nr:hypothetical protein [Frankiaceae bacterium]
MFSKLKMVGTVAAAASALLVAGTTFGATPASASATDTVVCTVVGSVTVTGGPAVSGGTNDPFNFNSTTITCINPLSPFAGSYNVTATGTTSTLNPLLGTGETCAQGAGSGTLGGDVTGSFSFTRVGTAVTIQGSISANGNSGTFVSELLFIPTSGPCVGGTGNTVATMAGTAVVQNTV